MVSIRHRILSANIHFFFNTNAYGYKILLKVLKIRKMVHVLFSENTLFLRYDVKIRCFLPVFLFSVPLERCIGRCVGETRLYAFYAAVI